MDMPPTPTTTPTQLTRQVVREYTSIRAFHQDARELYARTGYTISNTAGLAHRGLRDSLAFYWPHQRHVVITYAAPTNPWPVKGDAR